MTNTNRPTPKHPIGSGEKKTRGRRRLSRDQAECLLLGELRQLLARPIENFVRLYLAGVDAIALKLVSGVLDGDPMATELMLVIVRALDRPRSAAERSSEKDRPQRLSDIAASLAFKKWMN